jgi:hypothetical protein
MKYLFRFALSSALMLCVFWGCSRTKTDDFDVVSLAVHPKSKTVIFVLNAPEDKAAIVVKGGLDDVALELAAYLAAHGNSVTKATTYVELHDVKFLLSPEHTANTYHVSIMFDRPLAPGEIGRGFSLDGGHEALSFAGKAEAGVLLAQDGVIQLKAVPHELHYMFRLIRSPGKYMSGP